MPAKIKKGDYVVVLTGKDKGQKGEVLKVFPKEERVVVKGIKMVKRHVRPSQADPEGGIKQFEAPIHVSNVAHMDPKDNKPCLLYTSPSPRDATLSRMPSSA